MIIRLATEDDIEPAMDLEARHYIGNLDPSQLADGFISIMHSRQWFTEAVKSGGLHVAVDDDGAIAGFIAVTEPPDPSDSDLSPIMRAMLDLAQTLSFGGRPIAQQRYAFRGPVLIDRSARGTGLYSAFNAVTCEAYRDRYDIGLLFVAAENPRSLHTVTAKLAATPLAMFEAATKSYHLLAFTF